MPVRKVSAEELLGGKTLIMSANPAIAKGFKKLREAEIQRDLAATVKGPSKQDEPQR